MAYLRNILVVVFTIIAGGNAVVWNGPKPTIVGALDGKGVSAKPTSGPRIGSTPELLKRDANGTGTCGFVWGTFSLPITCVSATCVFDPTASVAACCNHSGCGYATSCVPYSVYTTLCSASGAISCSNEYHVNYCSDKDSPFCDTLFWRDYGVTNYNCASTSNTDDVMIVLTYSGLVSGVTTTGEVSDISFGNVGQANSISTSSSTTVGATTAVEGGGGSTTAEVGGGGPTTAAVGGGGSTTTVVGGGGSTTTVVRGGGSTTVAVSVPNVTGHATGSGSGKMRVNRVVVVGGLAALLIGML